MPPINASVTNQQITASVGETQIDVSVSGGVGPTGTAGAAASVQVGTVTTGAPGSSASVVNAGTSSAAVLNFTIPAGATGAQGQAGAAGAQGIQGIQGPAGPAGATGATGPAGSNATATTNASLLTSGTLDAARLPGSVVLTTDARLSDARQPLTHQHTASQISDFTSAVVAAAPPTTNASLLTSGTIPDARISSAIARTADVSSAVAAVVNAAPATLDTLAELASALGSDANFSTTVTNSLASKAPLASPTFTGTVSGNLLAINSAGGFGLNHGLVLNSSGIVHRSTVGGNTQTNFVLGPDGTITSGTWLASAIGVAYGGTGATTASAARTNLGLVIGTDVAAASHTQAWSTITSTPTTLAGYGITDAVGSSDARLTDARTPLSHTHSAQDVSGLAAVATSGSASDLGAGTVAVARLPNVLEKTVTVGNSGTSTTLSLASGSVQTVTLSGNCTFTMPTASAGASLTLILTQGGTFTATFTGVLWAGGTAPTITATANKRDVLVFVSDGTSWFGTAAQNF